MHLVRSVSICVASVLIAKLLEVAMRCMGTVSHVSEAPACSRSGALVRILAEAAVARSIPRTVSPDPDRFASRFEMTFAEDRSHGGRQFGFVDVK
jgi:hypothetical protein